MNRETKVVPVVLCGGSGSRLWPLSRDGFPKQFLSLFGGLTLFQETLKRLESLEADGFKVEAPSIICNESHRFLVLEQLREIDVTPSSLILEPISKNTAPALTLSALNEIEKEFDPILVVMPADQIIQEVSLFIDAIKAAVIQAEQGEIAILGVAPNSPNTGYGYVEARLNLVKSKIYDVINFYEKPNLEKAKAYLQQGGFFWNSGIFVLRASVWISAISQLQPKIKKSVEIAWQNKIFDGVFTRPEKDKFSKVPSISIDYAVMQDFSKLKNSTKLVKLHASWNDLGVWDSVWDIATKNIDGNASNGDVLMVDSKESIVYASSRLVATVGVKNLVVIETSDAVLVTDKYEAQKVKNIVEMLVENKRKEHLFPPRVHRPWGWYESIEVGQSYQVKRIHVKPGCSLSLQKHKFRSEHWVVVNGVATVTLNQKIFNLMKNESVYIPAGSVHRLKNNSNDDGLDVIEVQSGDYLGEDDIERLSDDYGR